MDSKDLMKKFFDPEEYITKIVGSEENEMPLMKGDKIAALVSLFTDPANKDVKEETLVTLKKEKAGNLLIQAIRQTKSKEKRAILVAACWESEINFSDQLLYFIDLACDTDYLVSLEAITTIDTMEGPFEKKTVEEGIKKVKKELQRLDSERKVLLNDLLDKLSSL